MYVKLTCMYLLLWAKRYSKSFSDITFEKKTFSCKNKTLKYWKNLKLTKNPKLYAG